MKKIIIAIIMACLCVTASAQRSFVVYSATQHKYVVHEGTAYFNPDAQPIVCDVFITFKPDYDLVIIEGNSTVSLTVSKVMDKSDNSMARTVFFVTDNTSKHRSVIIFGHDKRSNQYFLMWEDEKDGYSFTVNGIKDNL